MIGLLISAIGMALSAIGILLCLNEKSLISMSLWDECTGEPMNAAARELERRWEASK